MAASLFGSTVAMTGYRSQGMIPLTLISAAGFGGAEN
jgi:hypothetical protein